MSQKTFYFYLKDKFEVSYNMGEGLVKSNPDDAMDCFIKREFEGIDQLVKDGTSHKVLFVPDTFIYPGNAAENVMNFTSLIMSV